MATSYELKSQAEQRLADERGTIVREAPFRVALVYPSPYQVAMSSLGFQTLYRTINERDGFACERSFRPDEPADYRQSRTPLFTYESETPVADCDIVAFSVAYEVEVLGLVDCLDLMGLPLKAAERNPRFHPLIIAGGPLTFANPLPVAPFVDVMVMGEGEEVIGVLLDWWRDTPDREQFLRDAALLPGVYVPAIHGETLRPIGQAQDTCLPAYSPIITPNTELSSMHLVENGRGCHRGCSFCTMRRTTNGGMRAVDPDRVLATIPDYAEKVGLVGAATSDHPQIKYILREIVESGRYVALSSLRADRMDDEFVGLLAQGGARTLTVASDGASERMRKFAGKHIKEKHLQNCARLVRDHELDLLKLYVVIGYPGETMEDIDEMCGFLTELSSQCKVALGMSPLVAKKNTPLDGSSFEDEKTLKAKIKQVHKGLSGRVDIRATSTRWAWIEYELAQGGWEMADAAIEAWEGGGSYGAWKRAIARHKTGHVPVHKPESDRLQPGAILPEDAESLRSDLAASDLIETA